MNWLIVLIVVLAIALVGVVTFIWISGVFCAARVKELKEHLVASQQNAGPATTALPELVRAYAVRAGGRVGALPVFHARHKAMLTTSEGSASIALEAEQWTGILTPGIVWTATGSMAGLPVGVFDSYVDGRGELSARVLGTFRVAGGTGPEYDKGELMRYLSELPVYPDAILNARGLTWRQLDDRTVEVSADSLGGKASIRFIFDTGGDIVRMEADDRPMVRENGRTVPTPWHGTYGDYRPFGTYRVPAFGEVGWVLPDGLFTYWSGSLMTYGPMEAIPGRAS